MATTLGVGFYLEEHRQEILARFRHGAEAELGVTEPALVHAAPVLLHDVSRGVRLRRSPGALGRRAVLLILSQPPGGLRGLIREFGVLRRAIWETLAVRGHAVPHVERQAVDRSLDDALADAGERWAAMARVFAKPTGPGQHPPPLPRVPPRGSKP
jgi:hypothetical protein